MSGWFDGSGDGTNNAFYGIGAGHRRRRNAQRQRYDRGFGAADNGFGPGNGGNGGGAAGPDSSMTYHGYTLNSYNTPIGWVTKVVMNGIIQKSFANASKGATVNTAQNWVDEKVFGVDDGGWTDPEPEPLPVEFVPHPMPEDFSLGGKIVRAYYGPEAERYFVTVIQGTATLESQQFVQGNHAQAIAQYNLWKNMVIERVSYDAQESLSVDKGNYRIDLVVTQAASISGFFNGILNIFGLGTTSSPTARHTASVPQNMRRNTTNMAGKSVNLGSTVDQMAAQTNDWKSMPTKTFSVKVTGFGESHTAGNNGNVVVIKDTNYSTYAEAKAAYDTEVDTIGNNPTHYDDPSSPPDSEVDPVDGNGGDTTGDDSSSDNYNEDYVDPGLEQAAADAAAAAAAQAAADAAAQQQFQDASSESAEDYTPPTQEEVFQEASASSAENYNAMTVDIPATYQTQTYTTTVPAATSSSSLLLDNKVLLGAGAVTLVAGAYLLSRRD